MAVATSNRKLENFSTEHRLPIYNATQSYKRNDRNFAIDEKVFI